MTLREVKGQLGACARAWQSSSRRCDSVYGELLREFKGHFISRVKARHKEYALGTVHGTLLRELKVV